MDFKPLGEALLEGDVRILKRLLIYVKHSSYVKYTSTLLESWRYSVENLSQVIIQATRHYKDIPELDPPENGADDPFAIFAVNEGRRHKARGIPLAMFLRLMKYYRQSYRDYLEKAFSETGTKMDYILFLERCFDRIEIAIAGEYRDKKRDEEIRQQVEERIFRLTRVYNVLSRTNQAIARHRNSTALFEEICRIAVCNGYLKMAVVNRFDTAGMRVEPVAFYGGDPSFLSDIKPISRSGRATPTLAAQILDGEGPYICNDIRKDPLFRSRAEEAESFGFRSLATFQLTCQNRLVGNLSLYARERNFFQPDIVTLFTGLTEDISFALDNLERERQRQRAEEKLVQTSNQLKTLFEAAPLPIATLDRDGMVLMWNSAAEKLFGWKEEEIIGRLLPIIPENLLPEFFEKNRQAFAGEVLSGLQVQRKKKNGQLLDLLLFNAPLYDGQQNIRAVMAILMDVTEQKKNQEQIAFLAHHDRLTGLANRTLLADRFEQATAHARRTNTRLALCAIDLDDFKNVNDLLGHLQGDDLLCQIASRLQDSVRCTDTVCRMGGDEFVILFGDISEMTALTSLIRKVSEVFSSPFILDDQKHPVTQSMGVAVFPEDGTDFETLFKNADAALYFAKKTGRNNVQFYRREIRNQIQQRMAMEQGLRQAITARKLSIHYQPVCRVAGNRVVSAEALVRWEHPDWGRVPPNHFIGIAEEANLILPLGEWILDEVCRTMRDWDLRGLPRLPVAVNVSAKQIFDEGFPAFIGRTLRRYDIEPQRLELEVTENLFLENLASVEAVMRELKNIGVGLALDDFGTGYSSLSYLKRFRLDKLKIDRSFIADVCHNEQDAILTDAIILLGKSLGLKVVAEGVETQDQLAYLRLRRCDYYQGYLCSRPMPSKDFAALILRLEDSNLHFRRSVGT
jgi:diguanylate cyclase (GGDEF)-like protein/PAS domain S-box-containing protein